MLTQERLKEVLHYDPDTGVFTWLIDRGSAKRGNRAGTCGIRGYIQLTIDGVQYKAHRLVWLYMTGQLPKHQVDHIDRRKWNNAFKNLRDVTPSTNKQNQADPCANNKSGFLGVRKKYRKWIAQIWLDGKSIHIGQFQTPELAYEAYLKKKREIHVGCTS